MAEPPRREPAGEERAAVAEPTARFLPYDRRPRHEYHLTAKGTELVDVLMVMAGWGDRWLAGERGPPVLYRHHTCGQVSGVELCCARCGEPMHADNVDVIPGPGSAAAAADTCQC